MSQFLATPGSKTAPLPRLFEVMSLRQSSCGDSEDEAGEVAITRVLDGIFDNYIKREQAVRAEEIIWTPKATRYATLIQRYLRSFLAHHPKRHRSPGGRGAVRARSPNAEYGGSFDDVFKGLSPIMDHSSGPKQSHHEYTEQVIQKRRAEEAETRRLEEEARRQEEEEEEARRLHEEEEARKLHEEEEARKLHEEEEARRLQEEEEVTATAASFPEESGVQGNDSFGASSADCPLEATSDALPGRKKSKKGGKKSVPLDSVDEAFSIPAEAENSFGSASFPAEELPAASGEEEAGPKKKSKKGRKKSVHAPVPGATTNIPFGADASAIDTNPFGAEVEEEAQPPIERKKSIPPATAPPVVGENPFAVEEEGSPAKNTKKGRKKSVPSAEEMAFVPSESPFGGEGFPAEERGSFGSESFPVEEVEPPKKSKKDRKKSLPPKEEEAAFEGEGFAATGESESFDAGFSEQNAAALPEAEAPPKKSKKTTRKGSLPPQALPEVAENPFGAPAAEEENPFGGEGFPAEGGSFGEESFQIEEEPPKTSKKGRKKSVPQEAAPASAPADEENPFAENGGFGGEEGFAAEEPSKKSKKGRKKSIPQTEAPPAPATEENPFAESGAFGGEGFPAEEVEPPKKSKKGRKKSVPQTEAPPAPVEETALGDGFPDAEDGGFPDAEDGGFPVESGDFGGFSADGEGFAAEEEKPSKKSKGKKSKGKKSASAFPVEEAADFGDSGF